MRAKNALKRLERVGSENAESTQNLIEATNLLAEKIVTLFDVRDKYVVDVAPRFTRARYSILNGRLSNGECRYVAETRETALAFANDIADGLLEAITDSLARRSEESRNALRSVETAMDRVA